MTAEAAAELGACPFCGQALEGRPNRCPRCGKLLGDAADDLKRVAADERRVIVRQKNTADALFLVGLLVGGPLLSLAHRARLGLFVLLAGAAASMLYRYARTSLLAALLMGGLGAAVVAVALTNPVGVDAAEEAHVGETARAAYIAAIAPDIEAANALAEARGPGLIVAWFVVPGDMPSFCGDFPPAEVRTHLAKLGFERIVVGGARADGSVCSFRP